MDKRNKDIVRRLFADRLKRKELHELVQMDIVEEQMRKQWAETPGDSIRPGIGEDAWNKIVCDIRLDKKKRVILRIRSLAVAACVAAVAVLGGYFLFYMAGNGGLWRKAGYISFAASRDTVYCLPDSSEVWMRPNSSIRFSKDFAHKREVWLEGTSLFQVRKQSGSMFKVHIDQATIEVWGTRFLVKELDKGTNEVTLYNGSVLFNSQKGNREILMAPMQTLRYNAADGQIKIGRLNHAVWDNGRYRFSGMPLSQLIGLINNMYNAHIVFKGKEENSTFSGTIHQDEPLENIIRKICFVMDLEERHEGNEIFLSD